jgi:hypothetical protein
MRRILCESEIGPRDCSNIVDRADLGDDARRVAYISMVCVLSAVGPRHDTGGIDTDRVRTSASERIELEKLPTVQT